MILDTSLELILFIVVDYRYITVDLRWIVGFDTTCFVGVDPKLIVGIDSRWIVVDYPRYIVRDDARWFGVDPKWFGVDPRWINEFITDGSLRFI